uniref:Ig-like domain-containing protein n=1 Tax=Graphocephala atropunctata TaxID=36148 RepID=A0A1B6M8H5_9HEMI
MDFHPKFTIGAFSLVVLVIFTRSFAHGAASPLTPNTDFNNYKVLNYAEPLVLTCNESNPSPDFVMKWLKNTKPVTTSEGDRPNIVVKNTSLTIHRAMDDDVANYTCQLVNTKAVDKNNSVVAQADFWVVGRPFVKLPDTVTVIEEEKLKLECIVIGSPPPTVEWKVGNMSYADSEGRVKLSTDPIKKIKNNILELEPIRMSDRGEITCSAHNLATTIVDANESKVFIRVKDKYAALWPFLGICAEVIVLCTVIFIYEKKRNKAELEESDTDQSPEQKNTPDHGKDSVRHRK